MNAINAGRITRLLKDINDNLQQSNVGATDPRVMQAIEELYMVVQILAQEVQAADKVLSGMSRP